MSDKPQTIFRVQRVNRGDWIIIETEVVQNPGLSWKAKGLHTYLITLPPDWRIYITEVTKHATDKEHATRSAVKELMQAGYITRTIHRDERQRITGVEYTVYEVLALNPGYTSEPLCGFPHVENLNAENQDAENLNVENPPLLSIHGTEDTSTKDTYTHGADAPSASAAPAANTVKEKEPEAVATPAPAVAATPAPDATPADEPRRTRQRTQTDELKETLVTHFCNETAIDPPQLDTETQRREAGALWFKPIIQIAKVCDRDIDRAKRLISWTVGHMRRDDLTISSPKSIVNVAIGEQAKRKSNNGHAPADPLAVPDNVPAEVRARTLAVLAGRPAQEGVT